MNEYRCAYCGKEFNSPIARSWCEQGCYHKAEKHRQEAELLKKKEEERLLKLRHKAEHEEIEKELEAALTKASRHANKTGMHGFQIKLENMAFDLFI